jgi:hypothetical protein
MINNEAEYQIALTEALWYTAHPPSSGADQNYVAQLIKDLTPYEEKHGLDSSELSALIDSQKKD